MQVRIDIYEGESRKATANKLLDTFTLSGIPPLPAGEPRILVKFKVDFDGTLSASAVDRTPGMSRRLAASLCSISFKSCSLETKGAFNHTCKRVFWMEVHRLVLQELDDSEDDSLKPSSGKGCSQCCHLEINVLHIELQHLCLDPFIPIITLLLGTLAQA